MNKTQKLRNIFDKLFRVKTAVILWIVQAILYGLCLFFCYIINIDILMEIFGSVSWPVSIVAYASSVGAIIRIFINRDLVVKRKILAVILIVAVYFGTSGILYLAFNNAVEKRDAEIKKMLEEEGDLSEWTTEDNSKKIKNPKWGADR